MSEFEFRRGLDVETRLGSEKFDLPSYVKDVVSKYDSSAEIKQHKHKVQKVAEKTSKELKQNVYKNYELFIDTSKEISSLEAEMYQLSHLLHEHKKLTDTLQDLSLMEDRTGQQLGVEGVGGGGEQKEKSIATLLETVEGGSIVTEVPGRYLVHIGHLTELNQESFDQLGTITAFLLNDSLMVASHIKRRRGPVRFRFQALYELDSMAIVNVKDSDTLHYAFKILMFPDSHLYQAQNFEEKQRWMLMLESAKENHQASIDAAKKEAMRRTRQESLDKSFTTVSRSFTLDSEAAQANLKQVELLHAAEWLKDIPESLDVCIAQREFDEAVNLIEETKLYLRDISDTHAFRDIRARLGHRINKLSAILMKEMEASPSGSLRGGPRAARRAVGLLIRLGFSAKACELFLENYRQIIQRDMDDVKMEGTISLYISNFAATFFMGLRNAATEFERAFGDNDGSYSAFIVWCNKQLQSFAKQSADIIFPQDEEADKLTLSAVADCITATLKECESLHNSGMDFSFALMQLYHPNLSQALCDERGRIREQCATTGTAESWAPLDLRQEQAQLAAIQMEMENLGVKDFRNLIHDGGFVDLSDTTIHFCKLVFGFVNDVMRFYTPELLADFVDCFCDIFHNMIELYLDALKRDENMPMNDCIINDGNFVIHTLLLTVGTKIQQETGVDVPEVGELHSKLEDTFEEKTSREASADPPSVSPPPPVDQGYHQARKLSEAAASGLEGEEEGEGGADEAEQSSDEDDII